MIRCAECRSEMPDGYLICPACSTLIYRTELEDHAQRANEMTEAGRLAEARDLWRSALSFLPPQTRQSQLINEKIESLNRQLPIMPSSKPPIQPSTKKLFGFMSVALVALWKFKVIFIFVLTKAKLLVLGLTKASTFFSIFLSLGFYWKLFGWNLAIGFLLCIYAHEMGHVFALNHYGIKATAPMFIPGVGAFVRLKENLTSRTENAVVGLSGPLMGLIATAICYAIFLMWNLPMFAALTRLSAFINLFNLIPVWQLDGNRGFAALSKFQRLGIALVTLGAFIISHEGLLLLLVIIMLFRSFAKDAPLEGRSNIFYLFGLLILSLALLSAIEFKSIPI